MGFFKIRNVNSQLVTINPSFLLMPAIKGMSLIRSTKNAGFSVKKAPSIFGSFVGVHAINRNKELIIIILFILLRLMHLTRFLDNKLGQKSNPAIPLKCNFCTLLSL